MPTVQPKGVDQLIEMGFPKAGIDLSQGFGRQMPREMANEQWGRTTISGLNVRGFEANTQRLRGGSRPGLVKYVPVPVVAGWIIQELAVIVTDNPAAKS